MARFPILTGQASRRAAGVRKELTGRAASAREAAAETESEHFAASLRGKAKAYDEAAELVRALESGQSIRNRRRKGSRRYWTGDDQ